MKGRRLAAADPVPPLSGRLWLLGALAVVLAPHLLRLPLWLSPLCVLLLIWRGAVELRGWPLPGRWWRLLLTLLGIAAIIVHYRTLLGRDAGLALLTVMLCLKLLELRTRRDAMVVTFLGYFLVAGGFLYSQALPVGGYLFTVVLILTAALIALNHPGGDLGQSRYYLRLGTGLLLQALPIMLLLFVLFPRIPGPLWGLPKDAFAGKTGLSDHMTLDNITELADSDEVAFRVHFDGPVPPADQLYWRGPVLWYTNGRRWDPIVLGLAPAWYRQPPHYQSLGGEVRYTVTLEPNDQAWLFALDVPTQLPAGATASADFQLHLRRKVTSRQRYTLTSVLHYRATDISDSERRTALLLPARANPRTIALGTGWRDLPARQIVQRALAYFREQPFFYTRRPPPLGANAIDDFLFDTRRGFCEHYAAAFTTLMRAAGVPARIVTGYQGAESNPLGDYFIVRQSSAHAWSEVYLPEQGWMRVDPTAVIPPQRVETTGDIERFRSTSALTGELSERGWLVRNWSRLRYGWDAVNNVWNQWVLGYDQVRQQQLLERLGLFGFGWRGVIAALVAAVALVLTVVAVYLLRRERGTVPPAVKLYREFCRRLARVGLERQRSEGPRTFAERCSAARPDLSGDVGTITDLYIAMRYGPAHTDSVLSQLRQAVRNFHPGRLRR